ncbi:hypothetical protein HMPREF0494_0371 [Limosilactobacillus antri DSM 16041]|uniref:Uncharacterized protein n=2 Tax=Limosilactobacillus antri TaxID=227943 RepID=C8P4X7_9LACO|nr:hypothetical protein HMPREF0494_0371 [Limosilactobacillus antri DSM 16041]KRK60120.1 hypothetical protein FC31_GL001907 [Limosilactobacillus antri DSM 16041]
MSMKKKLWIAISILTLLGLWAIMYIPYNLEEYNYYYATHMKHKSDQYTFLAALKLSKLPSKYLPEYHIEYFKKKDIEYNTLTKQSVLKKGDYLMIRPSYISYATSKKNFDNSEVTALAGPTADGTIEPYAKKDLGKGLLQVFSDIQTELKRNSKKPLINLQKIYNWYFNWLYQKKF